MSEKIDFEELDRLMAGGWIIYRNKLEEIIPLLSVTNWNEIRQRYITVVDNRLLQIAIKGKNAPLIKEMINEKPSIINIYTLIDILFYGFFPSVVDFLLPLFSRETWILFVSKISDRIDLVSYQKVDKMFNIIDDVKLSLLSSGRLDMVKYISDHHDISQYLDCAMEGANPQSIDYMLDLPGCKASEKQSQCFDIVKRKDYVQAREWIIANPSTHEALYLFFSLPGNKRYPSFMFTSFSGGVFTNPRRVYEFLRRNSYSVSVDSIQLDSIDIYISSIETNNLSL